MSIYSIINSKVRGASKTLTLKNERDQKSFINLHRFAMVGPGDQIKLKSGASNDVKIMLLTKDGSPNIVIAPYFQSIKTIRFGDDRLELLITEISTDADYAHYLRLEQFHYKGINLQNKTGRGETAIKGMGGRRAILLASILKNGMSRAVAYIEIQMPLMMCKPRHILFSRPFSHSKSGIKWSKWLGDGQRHVNSIARIARVVVDPEFRGIGMSTILVEASKSFCKERWHISGVRPLFLEISAEMLRYINFVSKAGMHHIGDTEGNLQRIVSDLHSIEKGAEGSSGIMGLQKKYHTVFSAYCKKTEVDFEQARAVLVDILDKNDPRSEMASDEWLAFRPILRLPIPYYMIGLDEEADKYITDGLNPSLSPSNKVRDKPKSVVDGIENQLSFKGIEVWLDYEIPLTPYVRLIMDSFGIETQRIQSKLLGPVDIEMSLGNIALITGASGAGKSVLLNALSSEPMPNGLAKQSTKEAVVGTTRMLTPLPEGIPIFQYFAETYGPDHAFSALCQVGLSEAMIFIKPFEVLSMGQRYRAMFADLVLSDAKLWLIDEFCSNLDPITSKIISIRLRKLAQRNKRFVIVAAANTEHFVKALAPDQVLVVRTGGHVLEMRTTEYINGFYNKGF